MSEDNTEAARRALLPEMPQHLRDEVAAGRPVYTTAEMSEAFDVIGFMAPIVVVRRKSDDKLGSLEFTHSPRFYFNFKED